MRLFLKPIILIPAIFLFILSGYTQNTSHVSIKPLEKQIFAGEPITFTIQEKLPSNIEIKWSFTDTTRAMGSSSYYTTQQVTRTYNYPGIYYGKLYINTSCGLTETSSITIRIRAKGSKNVPQVQLGSDARNEVDDRQYIAYALLSGLDVLGINSIHNNQAFSEPVNYGEIHQVYRRMWQSDFPKETPSTFHGATHMLNRPESGVWPDTKPIITEASNAILAAARGTTPGNPVYIWKKRKNKCSHYVGY